MPIWYGGSSASCSGDDRKQSRSRRRLAPLALVCLVGVVLLGSTSTGQQPPELDYETALERIAERVEATFPKVTGTVVAVEGDRVILDLTAQSGISRGMGLLVFRRGKPFYHIRTGQLLGHFEDEIATVRVEEVREQFAIARPLGPPKQDAIRPGDGVRITAGQIKLAVLPVVAPEEMALDQEALRSTLLTRLKRSGRFELMPPDQAVVGVLKLGLTPEDLLREANAEQLRESYEADYLLVLSISEIKQKRVLDARLISVAGGGMLKVLSTLVEEPPPLEVVERRRGRQGRVAARLARRTSQQLSLEVRGIAVGDVMGDGAPKLVLIDSQAVYVYRWDGEALQQLAVEQGSPFANYLAVDVADVNRNGVPEIFVTNLRGQELASFALEYRNGRFQRIWKNVDLFLRVLQNGGREPVLLGQRLRPDQETPFDGPPLIIEANRGEYVPRAWFALPASGSIYEFTFFPFDRSKVVLLQRDGTLALYDGKTPLWMSDALYASPSVTFATLDPSLQRAQRIKPGLGEGAIQQRLILLPFEASGGRVLLKSRPLSQGGTLGLGLQVGRATPGRADLVFLSWTGGTFHELASIAELQGDLIDYQVADLDGDGRPEVIAALQMKSGRFFGQTHSVIVIAPLPEAVADIQHNARK